MKLGVLFSGGKDSCLALHKAMQKHEVTCLITVVSENPESFMFHTPNVQLTSLQAAATGLPLVSIPTKGKKEKELEELEEVIDRAKELFGIDGIVTGTIASVYQATRIQKICDELGLWCFNPLWQKGQSDVLKELVKKGFEVVITGVFAEPFGKEWLGRRLDSEAIKELERLGKEYSINVSGEGGEIETTVLDAPFFSKRIAVEESSVKFGKGSGIMQIKKAKVVDKE